MIHHDFSDLSTADLAERIKSELADRPGECVCPVFEDGSKGFRQKCPVHGRRSRDDFQRITALRAEYFSRLRAPASVRTTK